MTKHTPGPWYVSSKNQIASEAESVKHGGTIAYVDDVSAHFTDDESAANARLIAAAPELLEALKERSAIAEAALTAAHAGVVDLDRIFACAESILGRAIHRATSYPKVRAAIAKAEGGAS
jgi:hypothetical protein